MSSQRKRFANWRNAQRSTGPRTIRGKGRSKRNSLQHGLSVPLNGHRPLSAEFEHLASALAGPNPDPVRLHFAAIAAEAEIELLRVRDVRKNFISSMMAHDVSTGRLDTAAYGEALPGLLRLERYQTRALSRRNRAMRLL